MKGVECRTENGQIIHIASSYSNTELQKEQLNLLSSWLNWEKKGFLVVKMNENKWSAPQFLC